MTRLIRTVILARRHCRPWRERYDSPVITAEDRLAELPVDLIQRLVMAQGLFPEDRLFVPQLPAEPRPGGV